MSGYCKAGHNSRRGVERPETGEGGHAGVNIGHLSRGGFLSRLCTLLRDGLFETADVTGSVGAPIAPVAVAVTCRRW